MREADNLTTFMCRMSWKSGSLNLLEPSGPHRACYGTTLPLPLHPTIMSSSWYVLTKICDSVVECSSYIFELSRFINSKWQCLRCASIVFLRRNVRLPHFQKVDGRGDQPPRAAEFEWRQNGRRNSFFLSERN